MTLLDPGFWSRYHQREHDLAELDDARAAARQDEPDSTEED
jgi:hypothetical protein